MAETANAAALRTMAPKLCGSVIWSSTSTMPSSAMLFERGRGQGIGLGQNSLMHRIGRQQRSISSGRTMSGAAAGFIPSSSSRRAPFGVTSIAPDPARGIFESGLHRVPAIDEGEPLCRRVAAHAFAMAGSGRRGLFLVHASPVLFMRGNAWQFSSPRALRPESSIPRGFARLSGLTGKGSLPITRAKFSAISSGICRF